MIALVIANLCFISYSMGFLRASNLCALGKS